MVELQVQEMVTLDSTDVQEEIQVESEAAPKKWLLAPCQHRTFYLLHTHALALEIHAATIASASQQRHLKTVGGSQHLQILCVFEADRFFSLGHSSAARSKGVGVKLLTSVLRNTWVFMLSL